MLAMSNKMAPGAGGEVSLTAEGNRGSRPCGSGEFSKEQIIQEAHSTALAAIVFTMPLPKKAPALPKIGACAAAAGVEARTEFGNKLFAFRQAPQISFRLH